MEIFRLVMQTGSVKGAAASMHISEPAASKLLSAAERNSNIKLFERVKGRLVPTPEAMQLRDEVDQLWDRVERVNRIASDLASPTEGSVTVNLSPSLATVLVPHASTLLLSRTPNAKVRLDILVPHLLLQSLREGMADLGLSLGPQEHPDINVVARYSCKLVCVMLPSHRLAKKARISPRDLVGESVISFPQAGSYGLTDAMLFGTHASAIRSRVDLRSGQGACWFILAGAGLAVVDATVIAGDAFSGLAVRPFVSTAKLSLKVMHHRYRPLSRTASVFCDCFHQSWRTLMHGSTD